MADRDIMPRHIVDTAMVEATVGVMEAVASAVTGAAAVAASEAVTKVAAVAAGAGSTVVVEAGVAATGAERRNFATLRRHDSSVFQG
ncbi:MAG: hypothetical protein JWR10_4382 [Rubritepida sp.]|nr:hypothetical protein [Rubritepida sp.]